jgi:hypothetical protein
MQNGFIESFNGRLRDELLNETLFTSLAQARVALTPWRADYNCARPHSQIGWQTPGEFANTFNPRRSLALRNAKGAAPAPAAPPARQGKPMPETNSELDRTWGGPSDSKEQTIERAKATRESAYRHAVTIENLVWRNSRRLRNPRRVHFERRLP